MHELPQRNSAAWTARSDRAEPYLQLVDGATSSDCSAMVPGVPRVKPGDKEGSMLWRKTKPDPNRCLNPMPNGAAGLGIIAPDDFDKVERWIQQGAPNN